MLLSLQWCPKGQVIEVDGVAYSHAGPIQTNPSHDLAHLLVAAAGLPWRPAGTIEEIYQAEFNAVLVENLCVHAATGRSVLDRVLEHMKRFWGEDWKDPPYPLEEALASFARLDVEPLVRLAPSFMALRRFEAEATDYRDRAISMCFDNSLDPPGDPEFREELYWCLNRICSPAAVTNG